MQALLDHVEVHPGSTSDFENTLTRLDPQAFDNPVVSIKKSPTIPVTSIVNIGVYRVIVRHYVSMSSHEATFAK